MFKAVIVMLCFASFPLWAQVSSSPNNPGTEELLDFAFNGQLKDIQNLVQGGISVNSTDSEMRTALMLASYNGHTPVVKYLLDKGADLEAKNSNGQTSLFFASSGPFPETVEFLLMKSASVNVQGNAEGFTALMIAAAEGQIEIVRLLLAYGASPSLEDKDGDNAESFARESGHDNIVEELSSYAL